MPILWRYLLVDYIKVLLLTATSFIAILLTSRLEEIAHFATFGPAFGLILLYALYQIPYILPIAIPVSCLISSILLMQKLSKSHELTALRSAGFSLHAIITPILLAAASISICNLYVVSELATDAHLEANLLKNELRSINPLLILHNKHLMRSKGVYVDTLGPSQNLQSSSDVVIALPNKENGSINLLLAKTLSASIDNFAADNVAFISNPGTKKEGFGELLIENIGGAASSIEDFSHFVHKKVTHLSNDHLNMGVLLVRLKDLRKSTQTPENIAAKKLVYAEMMRRISLTLAPFTFTLMGLCFGISLGRTTSGRKVFFVLLLAACYMAAFFAAKGLEQKLAWAATLYFAPHLCIIAFSIFSIRRISRGSLIWKAML